MSLIGVIIVRIKIIPNIIFSTIHVLNKISKLKRFNVTKIERWEFQLDTKNGILNAVGRINGKNSYYNGSDE